MSSADVASVVAGGTSKKGGAISFGDRQLAKKANQIKLKKEMKDGGQ
jgi:hypothetical protein